MDGRLDLRIIPKFDWSGTVVEWFEKLELVRDLLGVKQLDHVISLFLTRGMLMVYQQLTKDKKLNMAQIKKALCC